MQSASRSHATVLTVAMLGTGQHRDSYQSVLTQLVKSIDVSEDQLVHLIDGPGATGKSKDHPMLGTYDFECHYDHQSKTLVKSKTPKKIFVSRSGSASKVGGLVAGEGYEDAIDEVVAMVEALVEAGKFPIELNLTGFSRGADTMLRLSNVLNAMYKRDVVRVNIFALDPVPGTGRQASKKARVIPDNVQEYEAVLMRDERGALLRSQDKRHLTVQRPDVTRVTHHLYHGVHGDGNYFRANPAGSEDRPKKRYEAMQDTPRLVWDDLWKFAERHGVRFRNNEFNYLEKQKVSGKSVYTEHGSKPLGDNERLAAYTRMLRNKAAYRSGTVGYDRSFTHDESSYFLHGIGYFRDKQHVLLFRKHYPQCFNYFFQKNRGAPPSPWQAVANEIRQMPDAMVKSLEEYLHLNLQKRVNHELIVVPATKGIPVVLSDLEKNKPLMRLWEGVQSITSAVSAGYDTSISKASAARLLGVVKAHMVADKTPEEKLEALRAIITVMMRHYHGHGVFPAKLAALLNPSEVNATLAEAYLDKLLLQEKISQDALLKKELVACRKNIIAIRQDDKFTSAEKAKLISDQMLLLHRAVNQMPHTAPVQLALTYAAHYTRSVKPNLRPAYRVIKSMNDYLDASHWFGLGRNSKLLSAKKEIAKAVKETVMQLMQAKLGADSDALKQLLGAALYAAGQLRVQHGNKKEARLDGMLRQGIIDVSVNVSMQPRIEREDEKIKTIVKAFQLKLDEICVRHAPVVHENVEDQSRLVRRLD